MDHSDSPPPSRTPSPVPSPFRRESAPPAIISQIPIGTIPQQQPTPLDTPILPSQSEQLEGSVDQQLMQLQGLHLTQDDEPMEDSTEESRGPLRSLENETNYLVSPGEVRLTDFDVVETLGSFFHGLCLLSH